MCCVGGVMCCVYVLCVIPPKQLSRSSNDVCMFDVWFAWVVRSGTVASAVQC